MPRFSSNTLESQTYYYHVTVSTLRLDQLPSRPKSWAAVNRIDRLVATILLLQSRRVVTAAEIARHFELTERTVYRDLAALGEAGVPIAAEAGVGYRLMPGYHLPPVHFSNDEAMALVTAGSLVEQMTDPSVRDAVASALRKIHAVLPPDLQRRSQRLAEATRVARHSPVFPSVIPLTQLQIAVAEGRVLHLDYQGAARAEPTARDVEPLGLVHYLQCWHLIAWCRLRQDVRDFRVDRIRACRTTGERAAPRPGFNLDDYTELSALPEPSQHAILRLPLARREKAHRYWGALILEETVLKEASQVRLKIAFWQRPDLAHWLLSLGTEVLVDSPKTLRQEVADLARQTAAHHNLSPS
ncbi:MAG: YafY family transcriptional regulator [Verrucomicrobiales bacterium]|nr:YafY family transcriptional regulator [Verrucomicrobiales bacterium]